MKTNKSRRIKRRSRFRNTRNKRKSLKRQRGGYNETDDLFDGFYNNAESNEALNVDFEFKKKKYSGIMEKSLIEGYLYINNIQQNGDNKSDADYKRLIALFGEGQMNFISIKKPSTYWSYLKWKGAEEIIKTLKIIPRQTFLQVAQQAIKMQRTLPRNALHSRSLPYDERTD